MYIDHSSIQTIADRLSTDKISSQNETGENASFKASRLILNWIEIGAIKPQDSTADEYTKKFFPVMVDLDLMGVSRDSNGDTIPLTKEDENSEEKGIQEELGKDLRYVIKNLVEIGVVPTNLAILVGRNLRPRDVRCGIGGRSRIDFSLYDFQDEAVESFYPETVTKREYLGFERPDLIYISRSIEYSNLIKAFGRKVGIELPDSSTDRIAYLSILAHEYGHAVHFALSRKLAQQTLEKGPKFNPAYAATNAYDSLSMQIYNKYPLPEDIRSALEVYDGNGFFSCESTSSERIARAYEFVMLNAELVKIGMPTITASRIVDEVKKEFSRRFINGFLELNYTAKIQDLSLADVLFCLHRYAKLQFNSPESQAALLYSTKYIGYGAPLSEEELKDWLNANRRLFDQPDPFRRPKIDIGRSVA